MADPAASHRLQDQPKDGAGLSFLELVPQLAAVVTAATVLYSVLYNWAYFETIYPAGIQLLTISDHVASALKFLPIAIGYCLLGWVAGYFRLLSKILPKPKNPKPFSADEWPRIRRIQYTFWTAVILGSGVLLAALSWPHEWVSAGLAILMLWVMFGDNVLAKTPISWRGRYLLLVLPVFCVLALMNGNSEAVDDLSSSIGTVQVIVKDHPPINGVVVLRYLDKGIIFRVVSTSAVVYAPWDRIEQVSVAGARIERQPRACIWFGILCRSRQPDPTPS